jgi:hypothetical protein
LNVCVTPPGTDVNETAMDCVAGDTYAGVRDDVLVAVFRGTVIFRVAVAFAVLAFAVDAAVGWAAGTIEDRVAPLPAPPHDASETPKSATRKPARNLTPTA